MNHSEKLAFDIPTFCQLYSVGRTLVYKEIKEGRLNIVKIGRRTLITADSAQMWLKNASEYEV